MQEYPKDKIHIYIRTNNNTDNTKIILDQWVNKVKDNYKSLYYDFENVKDKVELYGNHEWNATRFKVLGLIRQLSINHAILNKSHYFVADCDNFIVPFTLRKLYDTKLDVVAPLLKTLCDKNFTGGCNNPRYGNYHAAIDKNGYWAKSELGDFIIDGKVKGLIELPVVHCTYFIRNEVLPKMCYDYGDNAYEYVTFSKACRNSNIPQYLDNRYYYGGLTFADKRVDFERFIESDLKWLL